MVSQNVDTLDVLYFNKNKRNCENVDVALSSKQTSIFWQKLSIFPKRFYRQEMLAFTVTLFYSSSFIYLYLQQQNNFFKTTEIMVLKVSRPQTFTFLNIFLFSKLSCFLYFFFPHSITFYSNHFFAKSEHPWSRDRLFFRPSQFFMTVNNGVCFCSPAVISAFVSLSLLVSFLLNFYLFATNYSI